MDGHYEQFEYPNSNEFDKCTEQVNLQPAYLHVAQYLTQINKLRIIKPNAHWCKLKRTW